MPSWADRQIEASNQLGRAARLPVVNLAQHSRPGGKTVNVPIKRAPTPASRGKYNPVALRKERLNHLGEVRR